jgi:hypothetical protein
LWPLTVCNGTANLFCTLLFIYFYKYVFIILYSMGQEGGAAKGLVCLANTPPIFEGNQGDDLSVGKLDFLFGRMFMHRFLSGIGDIGRNVRNKKPKTVKDALEKASKGKGSGQR